MTFSGNVSLFAQRIGADMKTLRGLIYGTGTDLSGLTTTAKSSLVAAVNEVNAKPSGTGGATINDTTPSGTTTYSSNKINTAISAGIAGVVGAAPTALDTLVEFATALGNDANYAATITTALGNRVRVDAAQSFTSGQMTQGLSNLGAASAALVGDTTTDFVAAYVAALA